jgi:hypothetical protein
MVAPRLMPRARGTVGLLLFASLSLADLVLTRLLVGDGTGALYEANPLAAWCLRQHGWPGMAAFKLATVLLAGACIVRIGRHRPRVAGRLLVLSCGAVTAVVLYSCCLLTLSGSLNKEVRREAERTARLDERVARMQAIYASAREPADRSVRAD